MRDFNSQNYGIEIRVIYVSFQTIFVLWPERRMVLFNLFILFLYSFLVFSSFTVSCHSISVLVHGKSIFNDAPIVEVGPYTVLFSIWMSRWNRVNTWVHDVVWNKIFVTCTNTKLEAHQLIARHVHDVENTNWKAQPHSLMSTMWKKRIISLRPRLF